MNFLIEYSSIPILSYSIEKNAIKCFKFILLNGANPLEKAQVLFPNLLPDSGAGISYSFPIGNEVDVWDSFGFAGANGSPQFIKILQDNVGHLTNEF